MSNLIFSGQLTKKEAIEELKKPIYDPEQLLVDYEFVLKKFNLDRKEFEELMKLPRREHTEFKVEKSVWDTYQILKPFKKIRNAFG